MTTFEILVVYVKRIMILTLLVISLVAMGCSMDTNYVTVGEEDDTMEDTNEMMDDSIEEEVELHYVKDFSAKAVCNGDNNAIYFEYNLTQVPQSLMLEIDRGSGFELLEEIIPVIEGNSQFDICSNCEFIPSEEYKVRLSVAVDDVSEQTGVTTIDTSEGSTYTSKVCSSTKLPACGDSDGGKSFGQYGVVTFETSQRFQDECLDDATIKEYYCDENREVAFEEHTCDGSCVMGRCVMN
jgi:hypothetical protein